MEFWDKKLGLGIKLRRKEMNIRQVDLAERLHVEPTTISRWETGSGSPDISILPNLAYELGTTVDDLLGTKKRNKEDEIKKEKVSTFDVINIVVKSIIICMLLFLITHLFSIINHLFIVRRYVVDMNIRLFVIGMINFVSALFIFSDSIKKYFIVLNYKMKFIHKYPIGYIFEIKKSYFLILNLLIFFGTLIIDTLLLLI